MRIGSLAGRYADCNSNIDARIVEVEHHVGVVPRQLNRRRCSPTTDRVGATSLLLGQPFLLERSLHRGPRAHSLEVVTDVGKI